MLKSRPEEVLCSASFCHGVSFRRLYHCIARFVGSREGGYQYLYHAGTGTHAIPADNTPTTGCFP